MNVLHRKLMNLLSKREGGQSYAYLGGALLFVVVIVVVVLGVR